MEFEYIQGLAMDKFYLRMYRTVIDGTQVYKQVETKRDRGGYTVGKEKVLFHFGEAKDKSEFETIEEVVSYLKVLEK